MSPQSSSSYPLLGIGLMAAAMLLVPAVDGIAKTLSATHSPLYISWARYAFSCIFVLPWALLRRGGHFLPREDLYAHALRTFFAAASMCCFFAAISVAPMADVTSAYFVGPIIAAILSVLLLGEAFTVRKVAALALGFAGALIVVNPAGGVDAGLQRRVDDLVQAAAEVRQPGMQPGGGVHSAVGLLAQMRIGEMKQRHRHGNPAR